MKKLHFVFGLAIASLASTQSCMKCDHDMDRNHVTQKTVNASIGENTTYSYMLPLAAKGSVPVITADAAHDSKSTITTDAYGNLEYNYTPATNYTGTDVVVITTHDAPQQGGCFGAGNPPPSPGNCNGGHGGCNHPDDNTTITTINLTVTPVANVTAVSKVAANDTKQVIY
jgi:hypothetical protein